MLPYMQRFLRMNPNASDDEDSLFDDDEQIKVNPQISASYDAAMFKKYPIVDYKMMLAVRTDMGMTKGKLCAQCGHGALGAYYQAKKWATRSAYWKKVVDRWTYEGSKKVAVKVSSEAEL